MHCSSALDADNGLAGVIAPGQGWRRPPFRRAGSESNVNRFGHPFSSVKNGGSHQEVEGSTIEVGRSAGGGNSNEANSAGRRRSGNHRVDAARALRPRATRCSSPATAIRGSALAEREDPDLVILDMMMPKRSGFLVLEKLRRTRPVPLRVIMITANEGSRHKAYAEMLGVDDYIRKPFAMDRLMESGRTPAVIMSIAGRTTWRRTLRPSAWNRSQTCHPEDNTSTSVLYLILLHSDS